MHHAVADGSHEALQVVGFQFFQQRFYGSGVVGFADKLNAVFVAAGFVDKP